MYSYPAQKRHIFDQFGEEGLKSKGGLGGAGASYTFQGDPHKIFEQFFGGGRDPFTSFGSFPFGGPSMSHSFQFGGDEGMDFSPGGASAFMGGGGGFGGGMRTRQDPPIEHPLALTLEELYTGCTKKMKISRKILNPDGTTSPQTKVLAIDVKPGWKPGTKITFPKEGDQAIGRTPADIVFFIQEKPHLCFRRVNNDLHHTVRLSLNHALCGGQIEIPTIEGGVIPFPLIKIMNPQTKETIPGHGMPYSKEPLRRGNLIVSFDIQFPQQLTPTVRTQISKLLPVQ